MTKSHIDDLAQRLEIERGPLEEGERAVLESIQLGVPVSRDAATLADQKSGLGDRLADKVAAIGGSWAFIGTFTLVLLGWMVLNTEVLSHWGLAFDPYPYIFLNLMLSTLAAIQAPIIMMSQNRQSAKDRVAAQLDYRVNLRAELEILLLHEKIDRQVAEAVSRIERKLDAVLAGRPE